MSETPPATDSTKRSPRLVGILVLGILVVVAVIVASTLIGSAVAAGNARASFNAAMAKMVTQVEADDDAHAALANAEGSSFAGSASTVVALLTRCMGSSATAGATGELTQLAGFSTETGAPRDLLPPISTPNSTAAYLADARKLIAQIAIDKVRTAETRSDAEANLIVEDEVNQDLDGIASSLAGVSTKLVAKDVYATTSVKKTYGKAVVNVAAEATLLEPALASRRTPKISSAQSAALISVLMQFATECKAMAASSAAHKPVSTPAHHVGASSGFLSWHAPFWRSVVNVPNEFNVSLTVNSTFSPVCAATSLLGEGTASGPLGTFRNINVAGSPPYYDILVRHLTGTTLQWAVVGCTKKG